MRQCSSGRLLGSSSVIATPPLLVTRGRDGHAWLRGCHWGPAWALSQAVSVLDRDWLGLLSSYTGSLWKQFMSVSCEQMVMHYFWHGEGKGDLTLHMNRHLWGLSYQSEDAEVKGEQSLAGPLCPAVPFSHSWLYLLLLEILYVDTNTVGLMSIFILACQKGTVCSFWG